ncbi:MAG TPA: Ig domain-containing protein [Prosthecobacter sp.]|nr:Ig domain-containing protein [Prosthecobacter sp.]
MKLITPLASLISALTVLNLAHGQSSSPPTVTVPATIPIGMVARPYEVTVPTTGAPVTYKANHLPPGLTMDDATGVISGQPRQAGTHHVSVRAENDAGKSVRIEFDIEIQPLPTDLVGTYHGYVFAHERINGSLGARLEVRTTSSGAASGKLISGNEVLHFTGALVTAPDAGHVTLDASIPRPGRTPLTFQGAASIVTNDMIGNVIDETAEDPLEGIASFNAWRNIWSEAKPATAYDGLHTFYMDLMDVDPALPLGYGFGSIKMVNVNTGAVYVVGKTSDKQSFTTSTFIGGRYGEVDGAVLIYDSLYGGEGAIGGYVTVSAGGTPAENNLFGFLEWIKRPDAGDRLYPNGIGYNLSGHLSPVNVMAQGGGYPVPAPGGVVMGLPDDTPNNALISFYGGGIETEDEAIDQLLTIFNPGNGLVNKATVPANLNGVEVSTVHAATGTFDGEFTIPSAPGVAARKAPFQGQIVRMVNQTMGFGFFLLPEAPEAGETPQTAPSNSGKVVLQPTP